MVLNIYKEELDKLDLIAVANEFVSDSEHHKRFFGTFTWITCIQLLNDLLIDWLIVVARVIHKIRQN